MPRLARLLVLPILVALAAGCEKPATGPAPSASEEAGGTPSSPAAASHDQPASAIPEETPKTEPPTGPAADIQLVAVTPEELKQKIAENKGKAVLVDFWATWCVPCRKEYPHTVELSKKHPDDLVVYSVSMNETDEEDVAEVKAFLAKHADGKVITLQSATGGDDAAYAGFEITGGALPHYKVYGRDGQIVETFGGDVDATVDPEQIDAAVAKAIGG